MSAPAQAQSGPCRALLVEIAQAKTRLRMLRALLDSDAPDEDLSACERPRQRDDLPGGR